MERFKVEMSIWWNNRKRGLKDMLKNIYPVINVGDVIEKETLELLRDNPMEITVLSHKRYKDGIIDGFEVLVNDDEGIITIQSGILKFKNKFFWNKNPMELKIPEIEDEYIIKFKLDYNVEEKKRYIRTGNVIVEKGTNLESDELEIVRFIKREGAELRAAYEKYEDLNREYNTLNLIYRKYSCLDIDGRLDPLILKFWAGEAFEKENLSIYDIVFASKCLDYQVNRENTVTYINRKLRKKENRYSNKEIYIHLGEILENLGSERELEKEKRFRPHKIIVD